MRRFDTLFRSLIVAVPCVALVACGGGDGSNDGAQPSTASSGATPPASANENAGDAPIAAGENGTNDEVVLNADGVPLSELENDTKVEGSEAEDPGYAEAVGGQDRPPTVTDTDGDVGGDIAQTSDALLGTRGTILKNDAQRIADFLTRSTSYYSHTTYMNESTGTRRTDCSGLTGYMLKRVLREAYDKVPFPSWRSKPLAEDYFNYIATRYTSASTQTSARWRRITSVKNLKPGDMVVWKYGSDNPNTGHIMIVRDYPRAGRADRSEWIVPIIDSTSTPHSYKAWDSRATTYTGVGQGSIGLKIDSTGAPRAYYWTGGTSPTAVYKTVMMARIE